MYVNCEAIVLKNIGLVRPVIYFIYSLESMAGLMLWRRELEEKIVL